MVEFFCSSLIISFLDYGLKMLKVKSPVLHIFLLKLRFLFDFALDYINKCFGIAEILLKKSIKLDPQQKFYLVPIFILVLVETDPSIIKKSDK